MNSFETVLDRLERVSGTGTNVKASCPVPGHGQGRGDRNPSLSVAHTEGKTLLNCMNGCHVQDILMSLRLEWTDLFDEPITHDFGVKVATWTYQKPDGEVHFTVERWQRDDGKRFVQRVPGHLDDQGRPKAGYPAGFKPCLYHLPQVLAQAKEGGEVFIVEGEKSVSAATMLGLVATCGPNGAKAWRDYYCVWLKGASRVTVVVDNDEDGHRYGAAVVASLRGHGIAARTVKVGVDKPKADLYDHVLAGLSAEDLVEVNLNRLRPQGITLSTLLRKEFKPVRWAVDGLISSGLTLFGGSPKLGKSYVALDLGLGVACGGVALSTLHCNPGAVLMLCLDNDTERRVKERTLYLWGGVEHGDVPIEIHTEWPTGADALAACQEWAADTPNPLMIVVDTLVKAEPNFDGNGVQSAYGVSTDVLGKWARFAADADIAVVAIHHDRKRGNGEDVDWLDRFTGSRGLTASAQTLIMLDAERGKNDGHLRVAGRDIETGDLEMRRVGRTWAVLSPVTARVEQPVG